MKYTNPEIKEGINYSQEHPLKEFLQLLAGLLVSIVVLIVALHFAAGYLTRFIPFEYEKSMTEHLAFFELEVSPEQRYLQSLADRLSAHMDLPEGMSITVHYKKESMVNALATIGGNVFMYQGLFNKLKSEDALAVVMAHEIAHIKHRHPITSLGRGVSLAAAGAAVTGFSGSRAGEIIIGESLNLGLMKFSRDQEREADSTAIGAVNSIYGHIGGAKELFDLFASIESGAVAVPGEELLRSHPYSDDRWETLKNYAIREGWKYQGQLIPLSKAFK